MKMMATITARGV